METSVNLYQNFGQLLMILDLRWMPMNKKD